MLTKDVYHSHLKKQKTNLWVLKVGFLLLEKRFVLDYWMPHGVLG